MNAEKGVSLNKCRDRKELVRAGVCLVKDVGLNIRKTWVGMDRNVFGRW
jgi:hypothetical protein